MIKIKKTCDICLRVFWPLAPCIHLMRGANLYPIPTQISDFRNIFWFSKSIGYLFTKVLMLRVTPRFTLQQLLPEYLRLQDTTRKWYVKNLIWQSLQNLPENRFDLKKDSVLHFFQWILQNFTKQLWVSVLSTLLPWNITQNLKQFVWCL